MSKKEKTWFNWRCAHCEHRHRVSLPQQFEMPRIYSAEWECEGCGKTNLLKWHLEVIGWVNQKNPPKLKKRKQERQRWKKEKDKKDDGTKKDRGYRNDHK